MATGDDGNDSGSNVRGTAGMPGGRATAALTEALTAAPAALPGWRDLGITPLAGQLGLAAEQTNGHWCRRCRGIWFGYTLEVQCPICGNRKG